MKEPVLSSVELSRARKYFYLWSLLNAFSFNLVSGNIITLYTLRLGAGTFLIGLLSSFVPLAQIMPLAGRKLVRRFGTTRLMATFWVVRYFAVVPILFAPLAVHGDVTQSALILCVVCVLLFQMARGLAITGFNPLIGGLSQGEDRGSMISRHMLISQVGSIVVGLTMGSLLGRQSPLGMYTVFLSAGVFFGLFGAFWLFRLPEFMGSQRPKPRPLASDVRKAVRRRSFRRYMIVQLTASFAIAAVGPFLILFLKQVYGQSDGSVIYFTVIGLFGGGLISVVSGVLIDRLGAKPMYFLFCIIVFLIIIPVILAPSIGKPVLFWLYAGAIFLIYHVGVSGVSIAGQVYFFSSIEARERLNLGILSQMGSGLSMTAGSLIGGAVLEKLQSLPFASSAVPFRIYFLLPLGVFFVVLFLALRLERLGAYSIVSSLSFIFSPRDIKAMSLLTKLSRSRDELQEQQVIKALGESASVLSREELLSRLSSPRFAIRLEALHALADMPMDPATEEALISEVRSHQFTTAYRAAEILGSRGVPSAIPVLRTALRSEDYFLCGKAMVALARLQDRESIGKIEAIVRASRNPRIVIHGAQALEILANVASVPLLISKLGRKSYPYIRDEIILSLAEIIGIGRFFYPLYTEFLKTNRSGVSALADYLAEKRRTGSECRCPADAVENVVGLTTKLSFGRAARSLLARLPIPIRGHDISRWLADGIRSPAILQLERYRFLVAAVLVRFAYDSPDQEAES